MNDSAQVFTVPQPRRKSERIKANIREAAKRYKEAYRAIYGLIPSVTWDGTWFRLTGQRERIKLSRLKELTAQLKRRQG